MPLSLNRYFLSRSVHVAGWLLYFFLNLNFFYSFGILPFTSALLRSVLLTMLFMAIFYFNFLLLIPRFLNRKRMWMYFIIILFLVFAGASARLLIERMFVNENYPELAKYPTHRIGFAIGVLVVLLLISTAYRLLMDHLKAQDQKREILKEKSETELKFLKSQVNPHFLFNTLNNLYSLAYSGSEQTASGIMALSQMMRYLLYETGHERVRLESEVNFISNYIELEKLRIEDPSSILIDLEEDHPDVKVAPMIFIPFVENCFKHSRIIDEPGAWIKIGLWMEGSKIMFYCRNSISGSRTEKFRAGGVGMENVKKRLNMIYPGTHSLVIRNHQGRVEVELEIETAKVHHRQRDRNPFK